MELNFLSQYHNKYETVHLCLYSLSYIHAQDDKEIASGENINA